MKFKLQKTHFTSTTEIVEVDILEIKKFFYKWNGRDVIGIYPTPYDYTESSKDPNMKGFIYKCYWAEKGICSYSEIPDWSFKNISKSMQASNKQSSKVHELFDMITGIGNYEGELTEEDFINRYNAFKEDINLPLN